MRTGVMGDGSTRATLVQGALKIPDKGLVPVTVKMILDDANLPTSFHQMLYRHVTVRLVGRAVGITTDDLSAKFVLDDGTGNVAVNYWFSTPGEVPNNFREIRVGGYVHVVGRVDKKNSNLLVQAFSCWQVKDFNDITHHFLSTIHSYIVLGGNVDNTSRSVSAEGGINCFTITQRNDKDNVTGGQLNQGENSVGREKGVGGLVQSVDSGIGDEIDGCGTQEQPVGGIAMKNTIMSVIRRYQTQEDLEGVSVSEIMMQLGIDECVLRETLRELKEIGEIYETVDDDHYGAT